MPSILVSHPHVASVSARLAEQLAAQGKLAGYFTGLAFAGESRLGQVATALASRRPVLRNRILANLPARGLHSQPAVEMGARFAGRVWAGAGARFSVYDAVFVAHDAATAWARWPRGTTSVYAYEDGALRTFRRAAGQDMTRIWDLPTPHHQTTQEIFRDEARRWPNAALGPPHQEPVWKQRRKESELALASKVCVASAFTKSSLARTETRLPIVVAPYGFPIEEFEPRTRPPSGPFRVLSVGSQDLRKGTPYLLEAWKRAAIPDAELMIVGPLRLAKPFLDRYAGLFENRPYVPRAALGRHYAAADLLVFPTLGDGFGLVIQEAMCTGTPVVTTPCGGGPECITDGVDGWIVPRRNIDALVERLRACAADRARTQAIGLAARERAERWTWQDAVRGMIRSLEL